MKMIITTFKLRTVASKALNSYTGKPPILKLIYDRAKLVYSFIFIAYII